MEAFSVAADDGVRVASEPGRHRELNASRISFSKFHSLIAVRLQALYSERIIALPEKLSHSALAPMAWDTNRDVAQSHSCNPLSLVASRVMIFPTSDPFYYVDTLPPTPFCFFQAFFHLRIYLIYLTFTLP